MTPEQKAAHLDSIIYSDGFDELVAYRLEMSLESYMQDLDRLARLKSSWSSVQWEDYVDMLRYCRSVVYILDGWFTFGKDYTETTIKLNRYSMILEGFKE